MTTDLIERLQALGDHLEDERSQATVDAIDDIRVRTRRPASRRMFAIAASVAAVGLVIAGLVAINGREIPSSDESETSAPSSVAASGPITMLFPTLPSELQLAFPGESHLRAEPSGFQERLFGATDDPGDPARMVYVTYASALNMSLPCVSATGNSSGGPADAPGGPLDTSNSADLQAWLDSFHPIEGAAPFTIAGTTGYWCTENGPIRAGWVTNGVGIELIGGSAITSDQLVAFAQSLSTVPAVTPDPRRPATDVVADPLPAGWAVLVAGDVPFEQQITETAWMASIGGADDAPNQLVVHTWTGVDDDHGTYAIQPPVEAERVTIRGHQGYRYVSSQQGTRGPAQLEYWWTEQPGVVIYVMSIDLYTPAQLEALIGQMVLADANAFAEFNSHAARQAGAIHGTEGS